MLFKTKKTKITDEDRTRLKQLRLKVLQELLDIRCRGCNSVYHMDQQGSNRCSIAFL